MDRSSSFVRFKPAVIITYYSSIKFKSSFVPRTLLYINVKIMQKNGDCGLGTRLLLKFMPPKVYTMLVVDFCV